MSPPDWRAVAADFPINADRIWLNNCGISAMPGPVRDAMKAHFDAFAQGGILAMPSEQAAHDGAREPLARLLGCVPDELVLCHNTNEAMLFLSHGLDLAPGDRVLLLENEYPSNVYPWEHWRGRGVDVDFAPLGRSPEEFLAGLKATLTERTRVVSVSAVHWCTGMPLPLLEIGQLCAARGIDFFVDGAQGVGMLPIDVRAAEISAMGFSAWKWLLGPIGLAGFYVAPEVLRRLRFPWKGTGSVVDDHAYLPYRDTIKPSTDRYVLSTPNFNDWLHFGSSLRYLESLGMAAVRARIAELANRLADGLRAAGFQLTRDAFASHATGIIAAEKPGHDSARLVAELAAAGIIGAERLGRIRLAPHVFILESQIDRTVETLARLAR